MSSVVETELLLVSHILSVVTWANLHQGDVGQAFMISSLGYGFSDRSIQVVGTTGASPALTLQGSNQPILPNQPVIEPGASNWFTLTDPQGNALIFNSVGGKQVLENTRFVRPNVVGGDGSTNLTCWLYIVRNH